VRQAARPRSQLSAEWREEEMVGGWEIVWVRVVGIVSWDVVNVVEMR
jgi:hypothetical protein